MVGHDKSLKDRDGFKAIDLADFSDRNEEGRYWHFGGEHQVYGEVTYIASQARRLVLQLFKNAEDETLSGSKDSFECHQTRCFYCRISYFKSIENDRTARVRIEISFCSRYEWLESW
ncbi:MAG: hypothetical protein MMC33_010837 [Icmadophila ericetorum]|nr:hypothetical protein [Icmadophila ericetorum]